MNAPAAETTVGQGFDGSSVRLKTQALPARVYRFNFVCYDERRSLCLVGEGDVSPMVSR